MVGNIKLICEVAKGKNFKHGHDWKYSELIIVGFTNPPKCNYTRECTECGRIEVVQTDFFIRNENN